MKMNMPLFMCTLLASIAIPTNAMENGLEETPAKHEPKEVFIATLSDDHLPLILNSDEIKPYQKTLSEIRELGFKDVTMESLWEDLLDHDPALNKPRSTPQTLSWETAIEGVYVSAPYGINVRASIISAFLKTDELKKEFLDEFTGILKVQALDRYLEARIGLTTYELMSRYITSDQIGFIHECMMWHSQNPHLSYFFNPESILYDLLKLGKTDLAFSLTHLLRKLSKKRKEITTEPKA
jgi:hypothetical protein